MIPTQGFIHGVDTIFPVLKHGHHKYGFVVRTSTKLNTHDPTIKQIMAGKMKVVTLKHYGINT